MKQESGYTLVVFMECAFAFNVSSVRAVIDRKNDSNRIFAYEKTR
jgi:hypothetical protein